MDWARAIDGYCERTDAGLWSEPVNALTNLAFLLAAVVMWRRAAGGDVVEARWLAALLAAIGLGSLAFHTVATAWAALLDVLPICLFILVYIHAANRYFWGLSRWMSALGAGLFLPYALAVTPLFAALPFFGISAFYWPVPLLIAVYALALRARAPATARGLLAGAGLLCLSLAFRSLDGAVCAALPVGTHFLWHILNAVMLGWMIEVLLRHVAATRPGPAPLAERGTRG